MPQAQQLGRYLLLDRIAYGGMAEIFRAKTFDGEGRARLVAVKRVLGHLTEDDEFLHMIVDEARITALLHHQNIAEVYEFGHAGRDYFLAMEFVDGKDLRAVMERVRARGQKFPLEHACFLASEIARGLHAAHVQRDGRGQFLRIVHRDVSPSNVLCSYGGDVKLCDFGIAKATLTRIQTRTGVIKGKVKYMSPEQALGRKLDHRSDLFSLGTVLYEMLALAAPFSAATEVELIFAVREARKRPITDYRPDVPGAFAEILDRAMAKSRGSRYQSGDELAGDLWRFLQAYKPGYRREHLAQFLRTLFQEEIENELRHLEEYQLELDGEVDLGENLIADALGEGAPFTRFTPVVRSASGRTLLPGTPGLADIGIARRIDAAPSPAMEVDPAAPASRIHQESTQKLARKEVGLPPALHERETGRKQLPEVFPQGASQGDRPGPSAGRGVHEEPTRLHPLPEVSTAPGRRNIHEETTGQRLSPSSPPPAVRTAADDAAERLRDPSLPPPQASEPTRLLHRIPDRHDDEAGEEALQLSEADLLPDDPA